MQGEACRYDARRIWHSFFYSRAHYLYRLHNLDMLLSLNIATLMVDMDMDNRSGYCCDLFDDLMSQMSALFRLIN